MTVNAPSGFPENVGDDTLKLGAGADRRVFYRHFILPNMAMIIHMAMLFHTAMIADCSLRVNDLHGVHREPKPQENDIWRPIGVQILWPKTFVFSKGHLKVINIFYSAEPRDRQMNFVC